MRKIIIPTLLIVIVLAWLILPAVLGRSPRVAPDTPDAPALTNRTVIAAARAPSGNNGRQVNLSGRVVNDPEYDSNGTHFQFFVKAAGGEADLIVDYPANIEITAGDFLRIEGIVRGVFVGSAEDGAHIETLRIEVEKMDPLRPAKVLAPATSVWRDSGRGIIKHEVEVTVDRIEFARPETRVYLSIKNGGKFPTFVEIFNSVIEQKDQLLSPVGNPPKEYKSLPVDISPAKEVRGVLVFPPVSAEEPLVFRLRMAARNWEDSFDFPANR